MILKQVGVNTHLQRMDGWRAWEGEGEGDFEILRGHSAVPARLEGVACIGLEWIGVGKHTCIGR